MGAFIDLTGQTFGRLTVISQGPNASGGRTQWNCLCECGNEKLAVTGALRRGGTKSCGCLGAELRIGDLTGQTFGRWVVISRGSDDPSGRAYWNCLCECGTEKLVRVGHLRGGLTQSCGCRRAEVAAQTHTTHGMRWSPEYSVWSGMKRRCFNPNEQNYAYYGGRGITICPEWAESFETFYRDMGPRPSDDLSIDRIDVDGNYEPGNCRWATATEQSSNQRRSKKKEVSNV